MTDLFARLMDQWDRQQLLFMKFREQRYEVMFDILESSGNGPYRIIDLASGPGSLSLRFLKRFPDSRVVMVDQDPVLLRISREVFRGTLGDHSWIESNISSSDWYNKLKKGSFHAVLSTTAIHWLDLKALETVYDHCGTLLRPGGIFMSGDNVRSDYDTAEFSEVEDLYMKYYTKTVKGEYPEWEEFWDEIRQIPELSSEMKKRDEIYPPGSSHGHKIPLETHMRLLESYGFSVPGVVWSLFTDRLLLARKRS